MLLPLPLSGTRSCQVGGWHGPPPLQTFGRGAALLWGLWDAQHDRLPPTRCQECGLRSPDPARCALGTKPPHENHGRLASGTGFMFLEGWGGGDAASCSGPGCVLTLEGPWVSGVGHAPQASADGQDRNLGA